MSHNPPIAFIVNTDWSFLTHRLHLAKAVAESGARVRVICADTGRAQEVIASGFEHRPLNITRTGTHPVREFSTVVQLYRAINEFQPQLIHNLGIKPVIYGSLAVRAHGHIAVVNAVTGLGHVFTPDTTASALQPLLRMLLRHAMKVNPSRAIFQNSDDMDELIDGGIVSPERAVLIKGSGVDCGEFRPNPEPAGRPTVLLAGRLLWDKGIREFVDAARFLRARNVFAQFVLVGDPDPANPTSVPHVKLEEWTKEGVIEWWGYKSDMADVFRRAALVVLPTRYREGVPKVLIEACASGRPVIATDAPGCREIVRHGVNGILIPLGDTAALSQAIRFLLDDPSLRARYGAAGRVIAEAEFSTEVVIRDTLRVYRELIGGPW